MILINRTAFTRALANVFGGGPQDDQKRKAMFARMSRGGGGGGRSGGSSSTSQQARGAPSTQNLSGEAPATASSPIFKSSGSTPPVENPGFAPGSQNGTVAPDQTTPEYKEWFAKRQAWEAAQSGSELKPMNASGARFAALPAASGGDRSVKQLGGPGTNTISVTAQKQKMRRRSPSQVAANPGPKDKNGQLIPPPEGSHWETFNNGVSFFPVQGPDMTQDPTAAMLRRVVKPIVSPLLKKYGS